MAGTQITLITTVAFTFVATLFVLIGIISVLRRSRDDRAQRELAILAESLDVTQPTQVIREATQPMQPVTDADITLKEHGMTQEAFTPYRNLTRDQRNIRKLMEFLKNEAVESHLVQESVQRAS